MRTLVQGITRSAVCGLAAGALLLAGCASTRKFYDGPEREPANLVRLQSANSFVFSINGRRTDAAKDRSWTTLEILPGTQRLIVQLDEDMASRYGHVGVRVAFCARAGHSYTVYPVPDLASRTWQPSVRDDATLADVEARACDTDAPAREAEAPAPSAAPVPKPILPPNSAAAAKAAPATVTAPAPAASAPPAPAAPPAASPAPAAAPAAAVAPGTLAAGGQARLRVPARIRASVDAPAVKGLDAGVTVTLKVVMKKDTGAWWYVNGPGASGWARETELDPGAP